MAILFSKAKRKEGFLLDSKNLVFDTGSNVAESKTLRRLKSENKFFPLFIEDGTFVIEGLEESKEEPKKEKKKKENKKPEVKEDVES